MSTWLLVLVFAAVAFAAPLHEEETPDPLSSIPHESIAGNDESAGDLRVLDAAQLLQEVVEQGGNLEEEVKKLSDAEIAAKMNEIAAEEAQAIKEEQAHPHKPHAVDEEHNEELEDYLERMRVILKADTGLRKAFVEQDADDNPLAQIAREVDHSIREEELRALRIERERRRRSYERRTARGHFAKFNPFSAEEKQKWDDVNASEDEIRELAEKRAEALHYDHERREAFIEHEMLEEIAWRVELSKVQSIDEKQHLIIKRDVIRERRESQLGLHPGSRAQMQEAWKADGFDPQNWDPKIFFMLHDSSNDGFWDALELEALFYEQAKKLHGSDAIDEAEVNEEMSRMREHVLKESDTNKDGLLSYSEFVALTLTAEFDTNEGWKALDARTEFSEKDLRNYIKKSLEGKVVKPVMQKLAQRAVALNDTKTDDPEAKKQKLRIAKEAEKVVRKSLEESTKAPATN